MNTAKDLKKDVVVDDEYIDKVIEKADNLIKKIKERLKKDEEMKNSNQSK